MIRANLPDGGDGFVDIECDVCGLEDRVNVVGHDGDGVSLAAEAIRGDGWRIVALIGPAYERLLCRECFASWSEFLERRKAGHAD
jgi:phage/plasmid primase-like uncharacterized protein